MSIQVLQQQLPSASNPQYSVIQSSHQTIMRMESQEHTIQNYPRTLEHLKQIAQFMFLKSNEYCQVRIFLEDGSEIDSEYRFLTLIDELEGRVLRIYVQTEPMQRVAVKKQKSFGFSLKASPKQSSPAPEGFLFNLV